jgi:hypothetical protein
MLANLYATRQLSRLSAYGIGVYSSHAAALRSLDGRKGGAVVVHGNPGEFLVMSTRQHSKAFKSFEVI